MFWSKKVWDHNEEIPFPEDRAVIYKFDGQKLLGVWRDKNHGEPPGSVTKSGVISKKVKKIKQAGSSATSTET